MNSQHKQKIREFLQQHQIQINNFGLLATAFVHSSYKNEIKNSASGLAVDPRATTNTIPDNQRLEFIGDAVLGCIIKEYLYIQYTAANEGKLTRWTGSLVNQGTLVRISLNLQLDRLLLLGKGEKQSGGSRKDSNLADVFEALCGALYLDQGYEKTRAILLRWYASELQSLETSTNIQKDSKSLLQEFLQDKGHPLPEYKLEKADAEKPKFWICVRIGSQSYGKGSGQNRKSAEQMAAAETLTILAKQRYTI